MHQTKADRSFRSHRRGFTLLEILVSLAILVAITALSLAGILLARKRGIEIRIHSDLGLIGMALEAYKTDFGDYPRFDDDNTTDSLNTQQDRGARLLCRALLSPAGSALVAPATKVGFNATDTTEQAPDGADGAGFRVRTGGMGKVYGPYLDASKFRLGNPGAPNDPASGTPKFDNQYFKDATILDINGNSILYFPAFTQGRPDSAFVGYLGPAGPNPATPPVRPFYNAYDNNHYGPTTPLTGNNILYWKQMAYIMGDRDLNGKIATVTTPETAASTLPYLLWTCGADGFFGFGIDPSTGAPFEPLSSPAGKLKTDDVTNFDIPADLRK